eukprot:g21805.t1
MGKRNANLPSLGGVPPPPSPLAPAGDLQTMARMQERDELQVHTRNVQLTLNNPHIDVFFEASFRILRGAVFSTVFPTERSSGLDHSIGNCIDQELEQENSQLRGRYDEMEAQVAQLFEQLHQAGAQVAMSQSQLSEHVGSSAQFRDLKDILKKRTEEVKLLREYIASAGLPVPGTEGGIELTADDD